MKVKKKQIRMICLLFLLIGLYLDISEHFIEKGDRIKRNKTGDGTSEYHLKLDADGVLKDYDYALIVDEEIPDEEEVQQLLDRAKKEIDQSFCPAGEKPEHITQNVTLQNVYADGLVSAEWMFDNYDVVDPNGVIQEESVPAEGILVNASAALSCYDTEQMYEFAFMIFPRERSTAEQLMLDINQNVGEQLRQAGERYLQLPRKINGIQLHWSEKKPHYFWKILCIEILLFTAIVIGQKEEEKKAYEKQQELMKLDYPEIVSKILVLTGAGMSIKQSWNKISASYSDKRDKKQIKQRPAYELMIQTDRKMADGISERVAIMKFGEQTGLSSYQRLSRLLIENMQKGVRGLRTQLERESEDAFEERKMIARKLGEEAGTKMLIPMMIMLCIVMAIVMVPAIMSFQ